MKTVAVWVSFLLFAIVIAGAIHAVIQKKLVFLRKLDDHTRHAYTVLAVAAVALLAWAKLPELRIESLDVAGVKATVGKLEARVETLSTQMEAFFKRKKIDYFDKHNWNRITLVGRWKDAWLLQVTLEEEPIPGSIEVYEGVLLMPEEGYKLLHDGHTLQFPANSRTYFDRIAIKYYPRIASAQQKTGK